MIPPDASIPCTGFSGWFVTKGTEMAEYEHGSMDVTEQKKTFAGLMKGAVLVCVVSALVLIFLAIVGT